MSVDAKVREVRGRAVPLRGNDIDTDRIIPARYLRCVTFDGLGAHAFEDDRAQDPTHAFNQPRFTGAAILIAGRNFGCGSSREHAPQALAKWGIRGVVAESFAEIFFGNCLALGIPCLTVSAADNAKLWAAAEQDPKAEFAMDVAAGKVSGGGVLAAAGIPAGAKQALLEGTWNATAILSEAGAAIEATAARLPYLARFATAT